ncbi:hypothetical protein B0I35DRAFT_118251 [Stachybotrys elegans]|uniref:Uncharacterized protein n=1 Tax=Stachybotrys elegans TaxID=80388 RepID=A0A8K0SYL9_9HYPO|nr:hypothetical protein B0I35DRAFT_118251 [Stachybotrys elegans]
MPAPRVVRLGAPDGSQMTGDYLRGMSPSWTTLIVSLVVLAFVFFAATRTRRAYFGSQKAVLQPPTVLHDQQTKGHIFTNRPVAWTMDEKEHGDNSVAVTGVKGQHVSFKDDDPPIRKPLSIDLTWTGARNSAHGQFMSRPPPAPPLTPPELSTAVFTFEDRPRRPDSFLQQPSSSFISSTSTSLSQSSSASPPTPRRRSYNKTLPIGIPTPQSSSVSESEPADLTFSPSSYPPTSPLLPPAPPGFLVPDDDAKAQREIDVQGEIISVVDGDGAGWTRHTRVYGGGVCLACAASGGDHTAGGFYGATVRPEEMR